MTTENRQVMEAVRRSIPLETIELSDEFFPAHLSVALVHATFRSRIPHEEQPAPAAERYCRYFGIAPKRTDPWIPPRADEQESLEDLIKHYDELGVGGMADEVFQSRHRFPETRLMRADWVLRVARALRRIRINTLQDIRTARPLAIADTLRSSTRVDGQMARMFLMYSGDDDFVLGDDQVRQFVARAIGRRTISVARAVALVKSCAYELILAPRFLDHQIWRYGDSFSESAAG